MTIGTKGHIVVLAAQHAYARVLRQNELHDHFAFRLRHVSLVILHAYFFANK